MTLFDSKLQPSYAAGFWIRLMALIIDTLILVAPFVIIDMAFHTSIVIERESSNAQPYQLVSVAILFVASWLYFALLESSKRQATLGKRLVGVMVTDMHGNCLTFAKATVRFFGRCLSGLIFQIGYIIAAFTPRKRALHDFIAGTFVVYGSV